MKEGFFSQAEEDAHRTNFLYKEWTQRVRSQRNINSSLYAYRWQFLPKDPPDPHSEEFKLTHSWFQLKNGENVVKHETYVKNKRVVVCATDESLHILSKALSVHIDG